MGEVEHCTREGEVVCCTDAGSIGALSDLREGKSYLGGFISGGWRESDVTEGSSEAEDLSPADMVSASLEEGCSAF